MPEKDEKEKVADDPRDSMGLDQPGEGPDAKIDRQPRGAPLDELLVKGPNVGAGWGKRPTRVRAR